jgi:hypothetical protein
MKTKYLVFSILFFVILSSNAQLLIPVMNPIAGPANVCSVPAAGVTYSASANNNPISYQWSVLSPSAGIVISSTNSNTTNITFPNTNLNYTLICTATNAAGTSAPVIFIIKVYETPTVTFSGAQSFCQGSSTNLSASPTIISASSTLFYNWSPSSGLNTTTGPSVTANPSVTTTYSVLLTIATCTNMAFLTVTVNPYPSFTPLVSNTLFCKLTNQTLTINGNANSYSINAAPTATQSILNYSVAGGVLITVTGEGNGGCISNASVSFSVQSCIGINENPFEKLNNLLVYPNPNEGNFKLKNIRENSVIYIYNELGALIKTLQVVKDEEVFINGLSPGIYLMINETNHLKILIRE